MRPERYPVAAAAATVLILLSGALAGPAGAMTPPHPLALEDERGEVVDVNDATVEELQEVPGIGPTLAGRIVAFREEFGPYERVDDLLDVEGIGVKSLERIRPHVTVGPADEEGSDAGAGSPTR